MKKIGIICLVAVALYGEAYAVLRCSGALVSRLGKEGYWMTGDSEIARQAFHPAWIAERKARSLHWRVKHGTRLFGHVYWSEIL